LGVKELDEASREIQRRMQQESSGTWFDALRFGAAVTAPGRWSPKSVKTAICQQVIRLGRDLSLWELPIPRSWPDEMHPVITSGQIALADPDAKTTSVFPATCVVNGPTTLGWYVDTFAKQAIVSNVISSGRNLPVAITLGGDPIQAIAGRLKFGLDAYSTAGLLRGAPTDVVRCRTNELDVPADSEIIIEGYIDSTNWRSTEELTVACGNGRYVRRTMPLIQVTAVTHRANPVLPATIINSPPSEETWIGLAVLRLMLPLIQSRIPELVDLNQPFYAAERNYLFASLRKSAPQQAKRILHALWGMEEFASIKTIVIVDADVDVQKPDEVWNCVGTNACPRRDFLISDGLARDDDYTPASPTLSSRIGIDATRKLPGELSDPWPNLLRPSETIAKQIMDRWSELGLDRGTT
jgi:4-hydroxy-3-polyprenylbenzoate decarboxylase